MARNRSGRVGNFRERVTNVDRVTWSIIVAMFTLIVVAIFPYLTFIPVVSPAAQKGPTCTDLAQPIGGNNRSILAIKGEGALDIELEILNDRVRADEPLKVRVMFVNDSIGPAILYLRDEQPVISTDTNIEGLRFAISRLDTQTPVNSQAAPAAPPPSYEYDNLHLLGSRARCHQDYTYDPLTLQQLGIVQNGQYSLRAYYYVADPGVLPLPGPGEPTPTATPGFTNQGVWTGRTTSSEEIFSILPPATATPLPSATPLPTSGPLPTIPPG
jgi:hypothetical protein